MRLQLHRCREELAVSRAALAASREECAELRGMVKAYKKFHVTVPRADVSVDAQRRGCHYTSCVAGCRRNLESVLENYRHHHDTVQKDIADNKCFTYLCAHEKQAPKSAIDVLYHMSVCSNRFIDPIWTELVPPQTLLTTYPGDQVYRKLNVFLRSVHVFGYKRVSCIPEDLEMSEKRFLVRLLTILQYDVKIVRADDTIRELSEDESNTPPYCETARRV